MTKVTPMMKQYFAVKEKHPDCILFFRMGDFFEMFFEDAKIAAPILEIALTSRAKHQEEAIPMCGVPYQSVDAYINRLIGRGYKVAVCDQVEDPRQAKGIVAREVTRVVTPGMVVSPEMEDPKSPRYLAALAVVADGERVVYGLAALELSTGEFMVTQAGDKDGMVDELSRLGPAEVLVSEDDSAGLAYILEELGLYCSLFEAGAFQPHRAKRVLTDRFGVHALDGFGLPEMPAGLSAAGAALLYAQEKQGRDLTHVDAIRNYRLDEFMVLDESTKRNLELFRTLRDAARQGSLIFALDKTVTAMGGRKLRHWLSYPLVDRLSAAERHEAVENLIVNGLARADVRELLAGVHDLERLTGRIVLNRATPRDLSALKDSLFRLPEIKAVLLKEYGLVRDLGERLDELADIAELIDQALVEDPPATLKEGNLFKSGYNGELDELTAIERDGRGFIARLQAGERERTGIGSLKVGFNRVFGYYLEVTKANLAMVPDHYIRKQTLTGAERFITPELKEQEEKILTAGEKRIELEQTLFEDLRRRIAEQAARIRLAADAAAEVDALAGLAEAAAEYHYVRPELVDEDVIEIVGGRHPVIEQTLKNEAFVANDLYLNNDSDQVLIITGPNMAGKSTILRQTALIALMAQMGSFVPAEKARLGLVNRIFTRVGASDDLTRGRSTFMVEMNETAQILNQATPKSLVILDEIGRGTSTYDGLSIAWAVAEYLHDLHGKGVRTLFATHYHELVRLSQTKSRVKNFNVAVKEYDGKVIFLRKLSPGGTSRSYGIAVARLAGLPAEVLDRAADILAALEDHAAAPEAGRPKRQSRQAQMSLFTPQPDPAVEALKQINPDELTPLAALNKLAELKRLIQ